uniref:JAB1/MPN/MOV34 metalloenzyme domain-containing protein n=1 Tax=Neobodo designis TaxID=312471 RepID=A0A7S1W5K7_NEODS
MFKGYPKVGATTALGAPIEEADFTRETGPVMTLDFPRVERVVIDAHALLRIVKHARDGGTRTVSGTITGMQVGTVAEVTNAVPYVQSPDAEDEGRRDRADHQALIDKLGASGFDRFPLGRYACCTHSTHLNSRHLMHLEGCVRRGEPSVVIAYDPLRSAMGKLYVKAYVLGDAYLAALREELDLAKRPDGDVAIDERRRHKKMDGEGMLKEVPVEVYASSLQQQLLSKLAQQPRHVHNSIIANHDLGRYTERSLSNTVDAMERLRADVSYRQARHREDGVAPLRAETHVLAQQLKEQARHLRAVAAGAALNLDFARKVADEQ